MYFTATYYYGIIFSLKGGDYLDIQKIKSPLNELLPLIESCINNKGCFPLTVTGTSMLPTLVPNRDLVYLVSPLEMPPKKYSIVLFKRDNGKIVLHRIIKELKNDLLLINGDGQFWTEVIASSQIVAVVKAYRRNGKIKKCTGNSVRLYTFVWCGLKPIRPLFFKLAGIFNKLRRKNSNK